MARMTGPDDFLRLIREHPADDGPRLLFAEWLAERGDPASAARAEFVRIQCALAALPAGHPRRRELADREAELESRFGAEWARPFAGLADGLQYGRGFVEFAALSAEAFVSRGAELFRLAPVRRVRLSDAGPCLDRLARCPHLAHVAA